MESQVGNGAQPAQRSAAASYILIKLILFKPTVSSSSVCINSETFWSKKATKIFINNVVSLTNDNHFHSHNEGVLR